MDAVQDLGGSTRLGMDLATFADLAAGQRRDFVAAFDSAGPTGAFSRTYRLTLSDEDLPGETTQTLDLTLHGTTGLLEAVPEPSTWLLALLGLGALAFLRRKG